MATDAGLDQIERSTLATLVADQIRSGVLQGVFEPGSQLSEIALAERFGVSRGPVREALQAPVQDGLLKREPHRGVFSFPNASASPVRPTLRQEGHDGRKGLDKGLVIRELTGQTRRFALQSDRDSRMTG